MFVTSCFGKMTDFVNFEAVDDNDNNVNEINNAEENFVENVSDVEF